MKHNYIEEENYKLEDIIKDVDKISDKELLEGVYTQMNSRFYKSIKLSSLDIYEQERDLIDVLIKVQKYQFPLGVIIKEVIIVEQQNQNIKPSNKI